MESTKKTKCCKVLDEFTVYVVDGKSIRDDHHTEFIGGGHPYIYDFIPKDEIWLEDLEPKSEHKKILAHEMVELLLMRAKSWSYAKSHDIANEVEGDLRDGVPPIDAFGSYVKKYFKDDKELLEKLVSSYNSFQS